MANGSSDGSELDGSYHLLASASHRLAKDDPESVILQDGFFVRMVYDILTTAVLYPEQAKC